MTSNRQVYGARQYGENLINGLSQHDIINESKHQDPSRDVQKQALSQVLVATERKPVEPTEPATEQRFTHTEAHGLQGAQAQTILAPSGPTSRVTAVPLTRRLFHGLFLLAASVLVLRVVVFAGVNYGLLPTTLYELDSVKDGRSGFLYHTIALLAENDFLGPIIIPSTLRMRPDQAAGLMSAVAHSALNGSPCNQLEPTQVVLDTLATAAITTMAIDSPLSAQPSSAGWLMQYIFAVVEPIFGSNDKSVIHDKAGATVVTDDLLQFGDLNDSIDNADYGHGEEVIAPSGDGSAAHTSRKTLSLVDRISSVLVEELDYKPDTLITKLTGHAIVASYSFIITMLVSFSSLFYTLGIYLIIMRKWQRVYTFFKSVAENEMLVTEL